MDDMIFRQAAIETVRKAQSIGQAHRMLIQLQSAQPEIVRCKDCKHWYSDADSGMACEFTNMSQPEDGYCNWAERRADDNI